MKLGEVFQGRKIEQQTGAGHRAGTPHRPRAEHGKPPRDWIDIAGPQRGEDSGDETGGQFRCDELP